MLDQPTSRIAARGDAAPLVLIVDDYADAQAMYGLRLRQAGYRVAFAASGEDAVTMATELAPSVVVMDLCLPGKDGWAATRELKAVAPALPIIAVSGHVTSEFVNLAYEAGCDVFLPKPCLPDTLLAQVSRFCDPPGPQQRSQVG
jgi:two-component system cell cycle response regulator DivK